MPAGVAASDRKLLLIGGVLLVLMLTASVILAPAAGEFDSPVPSTYSSQSRGAEASYLLLSRLHYPVRRWEGPPTELDADTSNVLLILAEPIQPPSAEERKALASFVKDGGHVLFTGSRLQIFFPDVDLSPEFVDPEWKSLSPSIPTRFGRGAQHISIQPQAYWGRLSELQLALYGEQGSPAVVSWKLGEGEILWWAGSTPLTNAGITREDNLTFFLNCVANWSMDEPYQIYWDEYFHGQRSSLWSYVSKTSLAWAVFQLGLMGLAVVFTFSRRSGPVYIPAKVSRLSPLEFVDTLGGLYERAGAASSAVQISLQRFRSLLRRQLGLSSGTPDTELAKVAEDRLRWKDSDLAGLLYRAESSSTVAKLPPREALDIVQNLERNSAKLDVRAQLRQEKT